MCRVYSGFNYQDITYVTNQTEVYTDSCVDIVPASSAVLCTISQILGLTDASRSPTHYTHRQRRRARRFYCWLSRQKNGRFFSFDFARQALIPLPEHIRQFPGWDDSPGAPALSLEGLMALHPDLVVDCGNTDETRISGHGRLANRHKYRYCLTGNWNNQQNS